MRVPRVAALLLVLLFASWLQETSQGSFREAGDDYLPLSVGYKWVLRNSGHATAVVFEVVGQEGDGFRIRSSNPWGSSEWTLVEQDGKYSMIAYGTGGPMQPLPNRPLYLDFTRPAGSKWSSSLGSLMMVSRTASVQSGSRTYRDCLQIRQESGGNLLFTFAKGVGYVQFGEGKAAFVIDESASRLPGTAARANDQRIGAGAAPERRPPSSPPDVSAAGAARVKRDRLPIGITPNRFANEPLTMDVMMTRFRQTLDAGAAFLVANGTWAELEPSDGRYSLESLNQTLSIAAGANLPISYTLRVIDTIARGVPSDLRGTPWSDRALRARVLRLIDTIGPLIRGHARWFMFGYEIDGYFTKHSNEVRDFTDLYRLVKARMKEIAPDIEVSCTLTYSGIEQLKGALTALNGQLDFVALTYAPLQPDFTVKDPAVLPADFARMKEIAGGRKIVLQEIAYPTSPAARSSEEKQAKFYRLAVQELSRDSAAFGAVNFMTLADLSDKDAAQFASFYGMKGNAAFKGVLQTLGMFDGEGKPKKSWGILREALSR